MSFNSLALILLSVSLSGLAQIAFKFGVSSEPGQSARAMLGPLAMLATPGVLIGLMLYGFGTLLWLTVLRHVQLSQAYPFVGIGFALTTIGGWWLFNDQLSPQRIAGILLVVAGIILVARS